MSWLSAVSRRPRSKPVPRPSNATNAASSRPQKTALLRSGSENSLAPDITNHPTSMIRTEAPSMNSWARITSPLTRDQLLASRRADTSRTMSVGRPH